jgi:hypothetical protein
MNGFYESFAKELNLDWNIHFITGEPGFVRTDYLTKSVVVTERHPAYTDAKCATNHVLAALDQARGGLEMAGEPEKLAEVVVEVIENGAKGIGIPLRLPLGPDSLTLIESSLNKQLEDTMAVRHLAERFVGSQGSAFENFNDMV